jgi:K(+)-stimulated pyrophosphate-energized sodium pump
MLIAGIGILISIVGTWFVRISDEAGINTNNVQKALNKGNWGSIILTGVASIALVFFVLPEAAFYLERDFIPGTKTI